MSEEQLLQYNETDVNMKIGQYWFLSVRHCICLENLYAMPN